MILKKKIRLGTMVADTSRMLAPAGSSADCFQIRSVSQERLIKKIGSIDTLTLYEIKEAIKKVVE